MKVDLRSIKTEKALRLAMLSLLEKQNFGRIKVIEICDEALMSRAAFYAHYNDKYDLLKNLLTCFAPVNIDEYSDYKQLETAINQFIYENKKIISNIILDADNETLEIITNYIITNIIPIRYNTGKANHKDIVISNFFAGGIYYYVLWLVKNKFPYEIPPLNPWIYDIILTSNKHNGRIKKVGGQFKRNL